MPKPTETDLFAEEQQMVAMSFGDHIEELRTRLILALLGLFVGVAVTFIPPLNLGQWVMTEMTEPAQQALDQFYRAQEKRQADEAEKTQAKAKPMRFDIDGSELIAGLAKLLPPGIGLPPPESAKGKAITLTMTPSQADVIQVVRGGVERRSALISLAPLETFMTFFFVCMVTGLVIASPWVFYQIWAFIAAGLYRHERHYVQKFLPFSLGLFLGGVFLCFFMVLPYTLQFLLEFNVWLGIEPTLRITDWLSFATILPLVFGVCFQTPLLMMLLERVGIFTVDVYRSKRRFAILIMVVAAAVITPTGDPFTLALLAVPMILLYELGILLVPKRPRETALVGN